MAQNTFQTTSKVEKAIAFQWKAFDGFIDHLEFHNDELPSAVEKTGYSKLIPRPSRHTARVIDSLGGSKDGANDKRYFEDLSGNALPTYGLMADVSFPFQLRYKVVTDLQVSLEDLMFKMDREQAMDQHFTPAIIEHKNKMNAAVAQLIEASAGNTIVTDGSYDGYVEALYKSRQLMLNRAGIAPKTEKFALLNTSVLPKIGLAGAKVFQARGADNIYAKGEFEPIAGFSLFESPTLSTPTYNAIGDRAVVSADQNVAKFDSAPWTPTWSLDVTGLTNDVVIKAGTKIKFTNGSTDIRWIVPTVDADAGFSATFTVVSTVQASATGTATLTLSEPFISGGDFKNVDAALVAGTTKVVMAVTAGSILTPSYAFDKSAVWVGSPAVKYPKGVDNAINLKLGGVNISLIEDHYTQSLQTATKIISFLAVGISKPEAITCIY